MATMLVSTGFIDFDKINNISCETLKNGDRRFNQDCIHKNCLQPIENDFEKTDFSFLIVRNVS